jgi:cytochrome c biogenesis protein CcdA
VSSWLITSLGLTVAMTTGRLVVLTLTGVTRHPIGAVTAAGSALMLLMGCAALMGLRRRRQRISRRASIS